MARIGFSPAPGMRQAVYDSDKDGRVEKDALEITLNKLLKGAGPGANPTEIDVPAAGWTPTGDGGTKVAAADIEAAAGIPLTKLEAAVCSETEAGVIAAAAAKEIAFGTYTGNDANDRQITVGFKCSHVIGYDITSSDYDRFAIPNISFNGAHIVKTDFLIHGVDGFIVDQANMNVAARTFGYWAISE